MTQEEKKTLEKLKLETFFPYRLSILSKQVSQIISGIYKEQFGLTIPEWRVIAILGDYAPFSAQEVCKRTQMDKVKVSRAISGLLDQGLIFRVVDDSDRRKVRLSLTKKGEMIYQKVFPLALAKEENLFQDFSKEEKEQFCSFLERIEKQSLKMMDPE